MSVLSFREILPRSYSHKIGGSPEASCVYVATLDGPTDTADILAAIQIEHGTPHKEFSSLTCDGIDLDETDRHHATVTYSFSVPDAENESPDQPPWFQPDKWAFGTTSASVACTEHYVGNGNNTKVSLTNTAGDRIIGVSVAESELKITISGARQIFNLLNAKLFVNTINKEKWIGFPKHTVQCVGFSATPERLEWQGQVVDYWQISVELVYRSSSHNIFLPNVGWNVIVNGKKERAWTYITQDDVRYKVPSPQEVPLNEAGGFLCGPEQDEAANWDGDTTVEGNGEDYFTG